MLARLLNFNTGSVRTEFPSIILVLGSPSRLPRVLHIVPEDQAIECFDFTSPTASRFKYGGAVECRREQIGDVQLYIGDGETIDVFLDEVGAKATQLYFKHEKPEPEEVSVHVVHILEEALRSAYVQSIQDRANRKPSTNARQQYPVFLLWIDRTRPGKLATEADLTSFSH
ncbi:hypothetical protein Slin15195_G081450 [Septoria linicola]|uniref:Uncharacterized protein n=1 Tax=Septoria linicola TaxID=215465 RepID=A0A9Q9EKI0_9PEZI|nr:hypothetical protein Slin14017_G042670 [Septoria linicola]USW54826.1 hypothetical protein Slin15195_G081450 [Septoria linicola]